MTRRGWLLFLTLGVFWGMPYLFIRVAVTDFDPVVVAFGRTAIATLLLLPLALKARALRPLLPYWKILLLYTAVEIIGPWVLLGHVEQRLNSSTTGLLIAMVPMVAAIILTVTGHDRLDLRRSAGLLLGLIGVALLVGLDLEFDDLLAIGQLLLVVIGYAIGPIIVSRKLSHLPSIGVVTGSLAIAAVAYLPFAVFLWPAQITARAGLCRRPCRRVYGRGVPGDVRIDCRSRPGPDDLDHLHQSGSRHLAWRSHPRRTNHRRPRYRIPLDHSWINPRHLAQRPTARHGGYHLRRGRRTSRRIKRSLKTSRQRSLQSRIYALRLKISAGAAASVKFSARHARPL